MNNWCKNNDFVKFKIEILLKLEFTDNEQIDEIGLIINNDSDLEALKLACIPKDCDAFCRRIKHIFGKCTKQGTCECHK